MHFNNQSSFRKQITMSKQQIKCIWEVNQEDNLIKFDKAEGHGLKPSSIKFRVTKIPGIDNKYTSMGCCYKANCIGGIQRSVIFFLILEKVLEFACPNHPHSKKDNLSN